MGLSGVVVGDGESEQGVGSGMMSEDGRWDGRDILMASRGRSRGSSSADIVTSGVLGWGDAAAVETLDVGTVTSSEQGALPVEDNVSSDISLGVVPHSFVVPGLWQRRKD